MPSVRMRVTTVGGSDNAETKRAVAQFKSEADPSNPDAAGGHATVILSGDDAADHGLEEGAIYEVSFNKVADASADAGAQAIAAARAIPNATNTRHFKTPPELKAVPVPVPDGVVTLPRPSVVMEPVTNTPPDAGVTAPMPTVTEAARSGQAAQEGGGSTGGRSRS